MIGGINTASLRLSSIYRQNEDNLAETMARISSGKRIMNAGDDFSGYIRAQTFDRDVNDYTTVKSNLEEGRGALKIAQEGASQIVDYVADMLSLTEKYAATTDTTEQAAYTAEFAALASAIDDIVANTDYEGTQVFSDAAAFASIDMGTTSGGADTLDFQYAAADIIDTSAVDITDDTTVTAIMDEAATMLEKAESWEDQLNMNINMVDSVIASKEAAKSAITDIEKRAFNKLRKKVKPHELEKKS
jgi:flagellin